MTSKTPLLDYWFDQVWNNNNHAVVDELITPDTKIQGSLSAFSEPGIDYKEVVTALKALLQPIHVTVTHRMADGPLEMVRVMVEGQAPKQGGKLFFSGQLLVEIKDGRFESFCSNFDYFKMFEQLGQLPQDALPICLTGERLIWAS